MHKEQTARARFYERRLRAEEARAEQEAEAEAKPALVILRNIWRKQGRVQFSRMEAERRREAAERVRAEARKAALGYATAAAIVFALKLLCVLLVFRAVWSWEGSSPWLLWLTGTPALLICFSVYALVRKRRAYEC